MTSRERIRIIGGTPLKGSIKPIVNKNSILALLPVCLLTKETTTFHQVPETSDVRVMLEILKHLGADVENGGPTVTINTRGVNKYSIPGRLSSQNRASILFLGPLLIRFGQAYIGEIGGCKLGKRQFDTHLVNLAKFGGKIVKENGFGIILDGQPRGTDIWLDEAGVTPTENIILAAAGIPQKTTIYNAACEPHIQDLCRTLAQMGAKITGIGSNQLTIQGSLNLTGTTVAPGIEHLDIGALIAATFITHGELYIEKVKANNYKNILMGFDRLGIKIIPQKGGLLVPKDQTGKIKTDLLGRINKLDASPWPGFPVDLIPIMISTALFSHGEIIIRNSMFDTGLDWTDQLIKMGGRIVRCDPHRVVVMGPNQLQGTQVSSLDIIQAGVALFLAGLGAEGETVVSYAQALGRRYPNIVETYQKLGAKVEWD